MKKQKRRIQRPSYKAAATDLANRLNKAEDSLLDMRRDLSIATSELRVVNRRNDVLHGLNKSLKEANDRDVKMRQTAVNELLAQVASLQGELAERDKQLDQSRSVSVVLAIGWRFELAAESQQLDIPDIQDAFSESGMDPSELQKELMVALMGSYSTLMEIELKMLK